MDDDLAEEVAKLRAEVDRLRPYEQLYASLADISSLPASGRGGLQQLIETGAFSPAFVVLMDSIHRITWINRTYPPLTAETVVGMPALAFVPPDYQDDALRAWRTSLREGVLTRYVTESAGPDGTSRHYGVEVAPVRDDDDEINGVMMVATDITARMRAEHLLALRTSELAKAREELERFISFASDDLRAPLAEISAELEALDGELPVVAAVAMAKMGESARRGIALVDGLDVLSQIGRAVELQETDLNAVFRDVLSDLAPDIERAGAHVHADPLPTLIGDPELLRLACRHLLAHVLRFAATQPPAILVHAEPIDDVWAITVADNGSAMTPDHLDRIFDAFYRPDADVERGPSALALTIVRKVTDAHGGNVSAISQSGTRTAVTMTLPRRLGAAAQ